MSKSFTQPEFYSKNILNTVHENSLINVNKNMSNGINHSLTNNINNNLQNISNNDLNMSSFKSPRINKRSQSPISNKKISFNQIKEK